VSQESASQAAGRRVAANTFFRAAGELSGKLGTFVLFAVLARVLGEESVGTYVVAFAYVQVVTVLIDLGFDRVVIRDIALDNRAMPSLFSNVVALKLALFVPVTALSWGLVNLIGYEDTTRSAIYVLSLGLLFDSLNRTTTQVLNAFERGGLISIAIIIQRVGGAVLGLASLAAGLGVVAVCVGYTIGSAVGLAVALSLMVRHVGRPARRAERASFDPLLRQAVPFALYDSFGFLLTKVDTLVLSLLATQAAVGFYGGASRLYEASWFATFSLNAAFQAMFTYLTPSSDPSIGAVFERSIKLTLVLLTPITVAYMLIPGPMCALLFGEDFRESGEALRLLAPAVVLMGVASQASTLVALRRGPRRLIAVTGGVLVLNVALTFALVPPLDAPGAGLAMSLAVGVFAVVSVVMASGEVGGVNVVRMLTSPALGGAAMALVMAVIGVPALALAAGLITFALVFAGTERVVAPDDLRYVAEFLRHRNAAVSPPQPEFADPRGA
jgi:O-antigen/teichoic acid export membrane protein